MAAHKLGNLSLSAHPSHVWIKSFPHKISDILSFLYVISSLLVFFPKKKEKKKK